MIDIATSGHQAHSPSLKRVLHFQSGGVQQVLRTWLAAEYGVSRQTLNTAIVTSRLA